MNSIRTKFTLLTVCAVIVSLGIATYIGVTSIKNLGNSGAEQMLSLVCRTGKLNLESYISGVEHSVQAVTTLVQESMDGVSDDQLHRHVERARNLFGQIANNTNGVLTYYYRIDPEISKEVKGFWYVNLDGKGFKENEVTDISQFDTNDTSRLVWFTVPKATKKGLWLPPYYTENLVKRVISYNAPVYHNDLFIGVIGIEIDYGTLTREVENIRLFDNGYAFILDAKGDVIYHPFLETSSLSKLKTSDYPVELLSDSPAIRYNFKGVERMASWLPLSNGMRLYVSVPVSEINKSWQDMVRNIVLLIVSFITMRCTDYFTRPLRISNIRSKAKAAEGQKIISETERDRLTNLYNWNYLLVYANKIFREHPEKPMDAVVMDIDRFHSVNALHGWEFGDRVLRELGEEIQSFVKEAGGIAGHFTGDRFNLYCPHREDWQAQLERFQARLDGVSQNAAIHLRMGVKPWQAGMKPIQQFDRARTACNMRREDYKSRVRVYDTAMGQQEERDQRLMNDLARALEAHELEVYYQPKYYIQSEQPVLSSAEALVRWHHPDLGLIKPNEFIPLFERSGQISVLDKYVWKSAASQMAAWRDKYGNVLPVSVNLSRVDVFDSGLTDTLDRIVALNGIKRSDLKLEVTESAYTDNADELIRVIKGLRSKGYEIEMDDFGTGYSSLNMLSSMPVDILKMDIAFIRNIETNEKDLRLVEVIVDIARYLKVPVVAEGVETEGQLNLLRKAGCDLIQGYYFSHPLPADEFEQKILGKENKSY